MAETRSIEIPAKLYDLLDERVEQSGFEDVQSYVVFSLESIVAELGEDTGTLSREEQESVRETLEDLGYME